MLAGVDDAHDGVVGQDGADRISAAGERLAQDEDVRLREGGLAFAVPGTGAIAARGQQRSGAGDARLHFIGNEQHARCLAGSMRSCHKVFRRRVDTGFTLDGLDHEARHIGVFQGRFQRIDVVVWDDFKPRSEGAKSTSRIGVRAKAHNGGGAAVEVAFTRDDFGLARGNALDIVGPLAGDFDGGLDRFGAGVHGQHLVVTKIGGYELLVLAQVAVVKGPRSQCEFLRLCIHRTYDARVAMALVDGRVRAEEIEVLLALNVPDVHAFAAVQNNR